MDNITCENFAVGLIEAYPFCHQTLYLITVKQSMKKIYEFTHKHSVHKAVQFLHNLQDGRFCVYALLLILHLSQYMTTDNKNIMHIHSLIMIG